MGALILAIGLALCAPVAGPQAPGPSLENLAEGLASEDLRARRQAAWELWQRREEVAVVAAALVRALRDEDAYVRDTCARALEGRIHRLPDLLPAIAEGLRDDRAEVRRLAAFLLARSLGAVAAVRDPLLRALAEDPDEGVRANAAVALRFLPAGAAEPALPVLRQAAGDPAAAVRVEAITALGVLRDPGLEDLAAARAADESAEVRAALLNALHLQRLAAALPLTRVAELLRDPEWSVRWRAAFLLGDYPIGAAGKVDALLRAVADEHSWVRTAAAQSLGRSGADDPRVVPALSGALADEDPNVVSEAAEGLGRIGPGAAAALPALATAVREQGDGAPRVAMVQAIERVVGPLMDAVLPALEAEAGREPGPAALRAAAVLVRLRGRDDAALRTLLDALRVPETAADAEVVLLDLAGVSPGARQALLLVSQEDGPAATDAALVLARRPEPGPEPAVARLAELLDSKDAAGAVRAAVNLGRLGRRAALALPALRRAEQAADPDLRSAAADAIRAVAPR